MLTLKYLLGLILLPLFLAITVVAQQPTGEYQFPLRPGMAQWKTLKTHDEMLAVLQIPDNILKSISTEDLIKTSLNYPLFIDIWAYDNMKEGFEQMRKDFNGFEELLKREDTFIKLLKTYSTMEPSIIEEKNTLPEKGIYTAEFCKIEILLTQQELYSKLSHDDKQSFLKEIVSKHGKMINYPEFDIRSIESNVYLMGKVLVELDSNIKMQKATNDFILSNKFLNKDVILEIVSLSKQYLGN